ncbi:hypothetical protein G9A89_017507 [Geosiphon pyriformis]|nr:hypothetical protein G9A89_017507 [Geosiphon pyriformis]
MWNWASLKIKSEISKFHGTCLLKVMFSKLKTWVSPLRTHLEFFGSKELKPTSHIDCVGAKPLGFKQLQFSQFDRNFLSSAFKVQEACLRKFFFKNFPIVKVISPISAPVPLNALRFCNPNRSFSIRPGFGSNFANAKKVFFGSPRTFCSVPQSALKQATSNGSVLAQLVCRPFTTISHNHNFFSPQNILPDHEKNSHNSYSNQIQSLSLKIPRGVGGDKSPKFSVNGCLPKATGGVEILNENISDENLQVYVLVFDLFPITEPNTSSHYRDVERQTAVTPLCTPTNPHLVGHRPQNKQQSPSLIHYLKERANRQYAHSMAVISILDKILENITQLEIKISEFELKIIFPRGITIENIHQWLNSLDIDPEDPHFTLKLEILENSRPLGAFPVGLINLQTDIAKSTKNLTVTESQENGKSGIMIFVDKDIERVMEGKKQSSLQDRPLSLPFALSSDRDRIFSLNSEISRFPSPVTLNSLADDVYKAQIEEFLVEVVDLGSRINFRKRKHPPKVTLCPLIY